MSRLLKGLRSGLLMSSGTGEAVPPVGGGTPPPADPAQAPAADPAVPPVVDATPPADPTAVPPAVDPAAPPAPEPEKPDWRNAEINRLRQKLKAERQGKPAEPVVRAAGETDAELEARIEARATEIASQRVNVAEWDRQMNSIVAEGRSKFGAAEFNARTKVVREMVDPGDVAEVQSYNAMLAAASETGQAPAILHKLGGDPSKMLEIMALPPLKMAVELTRMAGQLAGPEPLSGTPKPITPIGSQGIHYEGIAPDDAKKGTQLPKAEWFAAREKQARERGLQ